MLDDVAGYGVDRAKFWKELTVDELPTRLGQWAEVFGEERGPQGGKVYSIQSVKRGERENSYWYAFDVWGDVSARIDELEFATWYPSLDRLDLKIVMPMTEQGRDNYRDYLKEKLKGSRSIRLMDSPTRQKRGSRDAGGHTLALGSHKSDYRVHWTLRGSETGYQEFQLEGTRLERHKLATQYYRDNGPQEGRDATWKSLAERILIGAQVELSDLDGLYDTDRASILSGRMDVHGVIERKLAYLEQQIDSLPRAAVFGLLDALNEKLFGTPPEAEGDDNDPPMVGQPTGGM